MRALLVILATLFTSCVANPRPWLHPYRPTTTLGGLVYCAKHHIPTISVIGYHSIVTREKIVLVHDWAPQALKCGDDSPNTLPEDTNFDRTNVHSVRGRITFCPLCYAEYRHCYDGNRPLSDEDIQQITSTIERDSEFRKPILHLFAVRGPNAVVIGGRQEHVGDVFSEVGLRKRGDKWVVAYPASSHRIIAIGREL
jgi:hypothetical protein